MRLLTTPVSRPRRDQGQSTHQLTIDQSQCAPSEMAWYSGVVPAKKSLRNEPMRRWNGWGDEAIDLRLAAEVRDFLSTRIGEGSAPRDAALDAVVAEIPPARLPDHRLVNRNPEARLRSSVGQSLEDWLRLRFGRLRAVDDGVAFPETEDEVREACWTGQWRPELLRFRSGAQPASSAI